jgi:hypothetical protein
MKFPPNYEIPDVLNAQHYRGEVKWQAPIKLGDGGGWW